MCFQLGLGLGLPGLGLGLPRLGLGLPGLGLGLPGLGLGLHVYGHVLPARARTTWSCASSYRARKKKLNKKNSIQKNEHNRLLVSPKISLHTSLD